MRYEVYESVGERTRIKEYEGTPEEIVQLISLLEREEETEKEIQDFRHG